MKAKNLAQELEVSIDEVKSQAIKCDKCGEIATVSVSHEFSSEVDFYCKSCQESTTLGGGDIITDYEYYVDHYNSNNKPFIDLEEVLNI